MTVHLFGATSSPGCANFALTSTANDFEEFGVKAKDYVRNDFYVDEGLKSVPSADDAVQLVTSAKQMCKEEVSVSTSLCLTTKKSSEKSQSQTEQTA